MAQEESLRQGQALSRTTRFTLIIALFVLIGPFIGGIVGWLILVAIEIARVSFRTVHAWFPILGYALTFAYPIGAPVAAVAGLVHAIAAIWLNKTGLLVPFFAALIAILAFMVGGLLFIGISETVLLAIGVVPASFVASFVCWRITRGLLRAG